MSPLCPNCGSEAADRSTLNERPAITIFDCGSELCHETGEVKESHTCTDRQLTQQRERAEKAEAAHIRLSYEVEQTLGKALGYPELYPHASKVDDGTVCVGEHVPESILDEAANALAAKDKRIAELEKTLNGFAKTEDGVTIVPDMLIWSIDSEGKIYWHKFGVISYGCNDWAKGTYSTREAAEAALAKGKLP